MVITGDQVWWQCYPKHTDVHAETHAIDYDTIRKPAVETVPA
jgi:hypothetical protein